MVCFVFFLKVLAENHHCNLKKDFISSLEQRPDLKLLDAVCQTLRRHVEGFLGGQQGEGDPGGLVDVLGGLAGLGHSPDLPTLGAISHVLRLELQQCSAAHISRYFTS